MRWLLLFAALPALACEYPDEGTMPLRRAVSQVKALPEVEAWAKAMHDQGEVVQYALLLEEDVKEKRRCYWTVAVSAAGRTWRRFQVSPDGRHLRRETADPRRREGR
ncbi:MAG TPA: hypothetical protein VD965_02925 [Burkholderiales bacterium]|nr:hypothetical protein [Burkholderiales bacterium]